MKQIAYIKTNNAEMECEVNSAVVKAQREQLIQAYRIPKVNEKGKKSVVPKEYFNTDIWIQITDPFVFKDIFPNYLHHIANEIDEWYIFVKKSYKQLINSKELKERKEELLKEVAPGKLKDILFESNHKKDDILTMNYFEVLELLTKYDAIKKK